MMNKQEFEEKWSKEFCPIMGLGLMLTNDKDDITIEKEHAKKILEMYLDLYKMVYTEFDK